GVFGIELENEQDAVIGMVCIPKDNTSKQILVVSENGLGKRTPFLQPLDKTTANQDEKDKAIRIKGEDGEEQLYTLSYRVTNRGGKGVKTINVTEKTGSLVGLLAVEETDDLMITCKSGITIRMSVANIRETGRATQGVKLINVDEGDAIAAIARIEEQEDNDIAEAEEGQKLMENTGDQATASGTDTSDSTNDSSEAHDAPPATEADES